jgi:hypothetical protein
MNEYVVKGKSGSQRFKENKSTGVWVNPLIECGLGIYQQLGLKGIILPKAQGSQEPDLFDGNHSIKPSDPFYKFKSSSYFKFPSLKLNYPNTKSSFEISIYFKIYPLFVTLQSPPDD